MFSKTLAIVALIATVATVAEAKFTKNLQFTDKRRALFPKKRSRRLTKVGQPPNNCWCGGARNSRGYTCPCFDVMEDNVGDGRVSGEYNNWPYRAEYNHNHSSYLCVLKLTLFTINSTQIISFIFLFITHYYSVSILLIILNNREFV